MDGEVQTQTQLLSLFPVHLEHMSIMSAPAYTEFRYSMNWFSFIEVQCYLFSTCHDRLKSFDYVFVSCIGHITIQQVLLLQQKLYSICLFENQRIQFLSVSYIVQLNLESLQRNFALDYELVMREEWQTLLSEFLFLCT